MDAGLVLTGGISCGLRCLARWMEAMVSGRGRRHRLVSVAPDDRCRAPVLACRDFPEPPACRHTARGFPDGFEDTVQDRAYRTFGRCFRISVVVWCHGCLSRTRPVKNPRGDSLPEGGSVLPKSRSAPERRARRRKRSGDPSSWTWFVTQGRVYGCPAYFCGTHTLIRMSAYAAHIFVKYLRYGARTPRFNA
jgi:hypothetical protein